MKVKIYKNIQLDERIESVIEKSDVLDLIDDIDSSDIKITDDKSGQLFFEKPTISNIKKNNAYLDNELLESPLVLQMTKNYLEQQFYLRPEGAFQGVIIKNNSLKILDKSSYGLYSDYICSEAHNFSFNTRNLRKCLTTLFLSFDRLSILGGIALPLEVDYGRSQDAFFVQFACNMTSLFKIDLLLKSMSEYINLSDCIEITFCNTTNRVVVRNFWMKSIVKKWTSVFIHESEAGHLGRKVVNEDATVKTHIIADVDEILIAPEDEPYERTGLKKQWSLIRQTLKTILSLRDEYAVKEKEFPSHFNEAIVSALIDSADCVDTFTPLEEHEKEIVIDFLSEEDPLESLKRMRLDEMIDVEPKEYMKSIYSKVDEIEYDTLKKISGKEELDENQIIKGTPDEKEKNQLVKGSGSSKEDNSIWEIKKLSVAEKLKSKYDNMDNPSPKEIEQTFEVAMKEVLSASDSNIESYVSGVVDNISEQLLPASVPNSKFINKTMGKLKNKLQTTNEESLDVSPLELKLMLSFTEKLIRKGENFEENLKHESNKNQYLKKQVEKISSSSSELENPISAQMRIANDRITKERDALVDEKNQFKNKIFELERKLEKAMSEKKADIQSDNEGKGVKEQNIDPKQKIINKLTTSVQSAKAEALDLKRQLTNNEKDMIKLKTQVARLSKGTVNNTADGSDNSKTSIRINQLEKINDQYLTSKTKMEKELAEKKSEIYKAKLESKTMASKVKQLEKKVELLSRRKAS